MTIRMIRIGNQKDFWSGVLLGGAGFSVIWGAFAYEIGVASQMGPGFFPILVGAITVILSGILIVRSLSMNDLSASSADQAPESQWSWRSLFWIIVPIILFGVHLNVIGIFFSIFLLVLMSSWASTDFHLKTAIVLSIVLMIISGFIFVWGLSLEFRLWPSFFGEG